MAKLVLSLNGVVQGEYDLEKERITVGRKPENDIPIDNLAVSGKHALIITILDDSFLEDLGSTNGTLLNGARVAKTLIKHGDVIQVGNYQFTYFDNDETEYEPTMFIQAEIEETQILDPNAKPTTMATKGERLAGVKIMNGPMAKKVLELRKPFNTIGFNGIKMAMIARNANNYTISALKSNKLRRANDTAMVNGKAISLEALKLKEHDIIELAGTQRQFCYFE